MKKVFVQSLLILVGVAATTACSVKTSGGEDVSTPQAKPFVNEVDGPSLDGTWKSGCERDTWSNGYAVFDMVIKGQDVTRTETKYLDNNCSQKTTTTVADGKFRFVRNYGADIYELEYMFKMPNGHYYTGDNIRRTGAKLYISDRHVGNAVTPDIPLNLVP